MRLPKHKGYSSAVEFDMARLGPEPRRQSVIAANAEGKSLRAWAAEKPGEAARLAGPPTRTPSSLFLLLSPRLPRGRPA